MPRQTLMLHVRVDDYLKAKAARALDRVSLSISGAIRVLLKRVAAGGALPASLAVDPENHDVWFRAKVLEALADRRPGTPHDQVMAHVQSLIDARRDA